MRLLRVEDEKIKVSDAVARALRAERYAVDLAGDGQVGWELAEAQIGESTVRHEVFIRQADLNYPIGAAAAPRGAGVR